MNIKSRDVCILKLSFPNQEIDKKGHPYICLLSPSENNGYYHLLKGQTYHQFKHVYYATIGQEYVLNLSRPTIFDFQHPIRIALNKIEETEVVQQVSNEIFQDLLEQYINYHILQSDMFSKIHPLFKKDSICLKRQLESVGKIAQNK